jgi:hypothetical protein
MRTACFISSEAAKARTRIFSKSAVVTQCEAELM